MDPYKMKQIGLYTSMSESSDSDMYEGCYWLYEEMLNESKRAGHDYQSDKAAKAFGEKNDKEQENKEKIAAYLQSTTKTENIVRF